MKDSNVKMQIELAEVRGELVGVSTKVEQGFSAMNETLQLLAFQIQGRAVGSEHLAPGIRQQETIPQMGQSWYDREVGRNACASVAMRAEEQEQRFQGLLSFLQERPEDLEHANAAVRSFFESYPIQHSEYIQRLRGNGFHVHGENWVLLNGDEMEDAEAYGLMDCNAISVRTANEETVTSSYVERLEASRRSKILELATSVTSSDSINNVVNSTQSRSV